jgi:hypothetical protein
MKVRVARADRDVGQKKKKKKKKSRGVGWEEGTSTKEDGLPFQGLQTH